MIQFSIGFLWVASALIFVEIVYLCHKRSSFYQLMLTICGISMLLWSIGYLIELRGTDVQSSIFGTRISYLGKPFALLSMFFFLVRYCNIRIPKWLSYFLIALHAFFAICASTCTNHTLFYSSIDYNTETGFLVLGHGPVYYLYGATIACYFIANIIIGFKNIKKSENASDRFRNMLVFSLMFTGMFGFVLFLSGITGGIDTTILGCLLSEISLVILLSKYHLLDALEYAKESMLNESDDGYIVENAHHQVEYYNNTAEALFPELRKNETAEIPILELSELYDAQQYLFRNDRVFKVVKRDIHNRSTFYGRVFEMNDITERYHYTMRLQNEVASKTKNIQEMQNRVTESFAEIVEARDEVTGGHIHRSSSYVRILCNELIKNSLCPKDLPADFLELLFRAAPLHDIGKIAIPDTILKKPARLSDEEFEIIRSHTTEGADIIEKAFRGVETDEYMTIALNIALYHHERWDGTGYPKGLSGDDIPFSAQIMSICDVYDALRSKRPYKEAYSKEDALKIIRAASGKQFNPVIVDTFMGLSDKLS